MFTPIVNFVVTLNYDATMVVVEEHSEKVRKSHQALMSPGMLDELASLVAVLKVASRRPMDLRMVLSSRKASFPDEALALLPQTKLWNGHAGGILAKFETNPKKMSSLMQPTLA